MDGYCSGTLFVRNAGCLIFLDCSLFGRGGVGRGGRGSFRGVLCFKAMSLLITAEMCMMYFFLLPSVSLSAYVSCLLLCIFVYICPSSFETVFVIAFSSLYSHVWHSALGMIFVRTKELSSSLSLLLILFVLFAVILVIITIKKLVLVSLTSLSSNSLFCYHPCYSYLIFRTNCELQQN